MAAKRHVIRTWECAKMADVVGVLRQCSSCSVHFTLSLEGLQLDMEPCQDTSKHEWGMPWEGIQAKIIYSTQIALVADLTSQVTFL